MADKKVLMVPFDKNGSVPTNPLWWESHVDNNTIEFKENFEFKDTLTYVEYETGRSAMNIIVKSRTNSAHFRIAGSHFNEILQNKHSVRLSIEAGILNITGTFTFKKQGQTYHLIVKQ